MGCGASSQSVGVVNSAEELSSQNNLGIKSKHDHLKLIPLPVKKNTSAGTQDSGITSNFDSDYEIPERRCSLTSVSDSEDLVCHNFITENSNNDVVERVESEFVNREELDLSVVGKSCPPLLSDKEKQNKNKKEEQESIELLKNNGLVPKPLVMKDNFALFEIVEEKETNNSANRTLPSRLAMQKEKSTLTAEIIKQRLDRANERKKENMKAKTVSKEDKTVIKEKGLENDEVLKRQARLNELRDKLKAKDFNIAVNSPRSKELFNELDKFRPRTASNFRSEF